MQLLEAVIYQALAADIKELLLPVRIRQARMVNLYAADRFERTPKLQFGHANPEEPSPMVMLRWL